MILAMISMPRNSEHRSFTLCASNAAAGRIEAREPRPGDFTRDIAPRQKAGRKAPE